jgi:hypothetical protein
MYLPAERLAIASESRKIMAMRNEEKERLAARAGHALQAGCAALLALQQPDGSFPLLQRHPRTAWWGCHPLFATVSVVLAAGSLMPKEALSRAAGFLSRCRRSDGLWEFDPSFGIPPDVDDTACAIAALVRCGDRRVGPQDAALLRSFWRADGGPFQTWRGTGMWSARDRDDPVVNCNVLHALSVLGAPATGTETEAVQKLIRQSAGSCGGRVRGQALPTRSGPPYCHGQSRKPNTSCA